jgi:TRAP-type mannitol/chloroaromatic compound transport system permease small subunit
MDRLLSISNALRTIIVKIAGWSGWLFVVCVVVICFDVLTRKFGYQLPGMGSTRLQELEWHLHLTIFSLWLGMAYIKNADVRIDIAFANASPRTHALWEFWGLIVFAIPYCLVALYFATNFALVSFVQNEMSDAASGLPYRFIPKSIIAVGLLLLLMAVISVLLRIIVLLYGPERLRKDATFGAIRAH